MSRLTAAHPAAGRMDSVHGDEDGHWPTAQEQALIDGLADQKLADRLYNDPAQFADLMAGIEPTDYWPQLQRALRELDRACKGDVISRDAVMTALTQIQRLFKREAERVWLDELKDEAAGEVCGVME